MSERQAKLRRKEQNQQEVKKPVNVMGIVFYVVSFLVIAAFVCLAGMYIGKKLGNKNPQPVAEQSMEETQEPQIQTLAELAEQKGQTFEEMAAAAGLDTTVYTPDMLLENAYEMFTIANASVIDYDLPYEEFAAQYKIDTAAIPAETLYKDATGLFTIETMTLLNEGTEYEVFAGNNGIDTAKIPATTPHQEAYDMFTLENYATMSGMTTDDLKTQAGLPADVDTTVSLNELPTSVVMLFNGIQATLEDLKANGLPGEITEETKWADSKADIKTAYEKYNEALSAAAEVPAEADIPAEETTDGSAE